MQVSKEGHKTTIILGGGEITYNNFEKYLDKQLKMDCILNVRLQSIILKSPMDPHAIEDLKDFALACFGHLATFGEEEDTAHGYLLYCPNLLVAEEEEEGKEVTFTTTDEDAIRIAKQNLIELRENIWVDECDKDKLFTFMPFLGEELCYTSEAQALNAKKKKRKLLATKPRTDLLLKRNNKKKQKKSS